MKTLVLMLIPLIASAQIYRGGAGGNVYRPITATVTTDTTNWYIANNGSDANSGHATNVPKLTLASVEGLLEPGDTVFLRRNHVWREYFNITDDGTSGSPIVITAYGNGANPILYGSLDKSASGDWENDAGNIWKSTAKFTYYSWAYADIGNVIFNDGTSCGVKRRASTGQCVSQGDFFYNRTDSLLYMYSVGNPATVYTQIDVCPRFLSQSAGWPAIASVDNHDYVTFHGIDFKYGGAEGLWIDNGTDNVIVENCDFSWIGGAYTSAAADSIREGNAVQIWETNADITVRYCTFDQIYDEAVALQGSAVGQTKDRIWVHHNLANRCGHASISFWIRGGETSTADSIFIENNTCVNGGGWSATQRRDTNGNQQFKIGYCDSATLSNIYIRNNIFDSVLVVGGTFSEGSGTAGQIAHTSYWLDSAQLAALTFDNNSYRQTAGKTMIYYDQTNYTAAEFADYQSASSQDANSRTGTSGFVSESDFSLQSTSECINAGVDCGYTQDILGNPIVGLPDIGCYENLGPDSLGSVSSLAWYVNVNQLTASEGDSIAAVPDSIGQIDLVATADNGRQFVYQDSVFGAYPAIVSTGGSVQCMTADSLVQYVRGDDIAYTQFFGWALDTSSTVAWRYFSQFGSDKARIIMYGANSFGETPNLTYSRTGNQDYEVYTDTLFQGHVWAYVYSADSVRLYKDGILAMGPTVVASAAIYPTYFTIGAERQSDARYATPIKFSFSALYRKALTAAEVLTITNLVKKYVGR